MYSAHIEFNTHTIFIIIIIIVVQKCMCKICTILVAFIISIFVCFVKTCVIFVGVKCRCVLLMVGVQITKGEGLNACRRFKCDACRLFLLITACVKLPEGLNLSFVHRVYYIVLCFN